MTTAIDIRSDFIIDFEDEDYRLSTSKDLLEQGYKPLFIPKNSRPLFISYKFNKAKDLYELFVPVVLDYGFMYFEGLKNVNQLVYSNLLLNLNNKEFELKIKDAYDQNNPYFNSLNLEQDFLSSDFPLIENELLHYQGKKKVSDLIYSGHKFTPDMLSVDLISEFAIDKLKSVNGYQFMSFYDIAFSIQNPKTNENVFFVHKNYLTDSKQCLERIISNF